MEMTFFPFQVLDWAGVSKEERKGTTGHAYWQVFMMGDTRIRMVEYSPGYFADHWCNKGHIIYCIEGEMITELEDGREFTLSKGMTYHVGDDSNAHRSKTKDGCKLFVVD